MPFLLGTDEAGYGPNLGPLVISASVWEVPDGGDDLYAAGGGDRANLPRKKRGVRFYPPSLTSNSQGDESQRQRSFDLLGFTLYWGRSRKGTWVVQQKTMKSRFRRALRHITLWCQENRHMPVSEQSKTLSQKLRGHYSYYGVTGNGRALENLYDEVKRIWHKWLGRRSNRPLNWDRMLAILKAFPLSRPRIVHSVYLRVAKP